jgi:U6 snRNA-associated Sm-like protein LSm1
LGEIVCAFSHAFSTTPLITTFLQDLDQEDDVPLRQVDYKQLDDYYREDVAAKRQREEAKAKILYEQKGFCKEGGEGDGY